MKSSIFRKDLIYVAGRLNGNAPQYIQNLNTMTGYANELMDMYDVAVISPGNDFIQGLLHGGLKYDDYLKNTREQLIRCDGMYVTPDWENSAGVIKEIEIAKQYGIPIFYNDVELCDFINRPKILAITGKSGSGKTTIAQYIEDKYKIKMIESHTDRPKRTPDEVGHTFHTPDEYDQKCKREEMIAFTKWNNWRYCCLEEDVLPENTYVIDEKGLTMMGANYKEKYKIFKLHIHRDTILRLKNVDLDRIERDDEYFYLPRHYYDVILTNNLSIQHIYDKVDYIVNGFFYNKIIPDKDEVMYKRLKVV